MNFQMFQTRFKGQNPSEIDLAAYIDDKSKQEDESCQLPCSSITLFILLGFFFIIMGITALVSNYQQTILSVELKQSDWYLSSEPLYVPFSAQSTVDVYLKIQQLTQYDYLVNPSPYNDYFAPNSEICGKYKLNQNLNKTTNIKGNQLNVSDYAVPCGYFAAMYPQGDVTVTLNNNSNIVLDQRDLVYFPYSPYQYDFVQGKQWVDLSDPFFQAWISQNAAITTTKLIGKLAGNFPGYFSIQIQLKNALPAKYGKATILLSKRQGFGTSDVAFCVITFAQSGLLFLFAFAVFFYNKVLTAELKKNQMQAHQIELKSQSEAISVKIADI